MARDFFFNNQTESLKTKSIFTVIKKSMNVLNSSLDTAIERISELDNVLEEMNQNAAQREKEMKNTKA